MRTFYIRHPHRTLADTLTEPWLAPPPCPLQPHRNPVPSRPVPIISQHGVWDSGCAPAKLVEPDLVQVVIHGHAPSR